LLQVDEVQDVDGPRSLGVERLQLLGRDHDVLVAGDLVALDDVLKGDLLAVLGADPLLLDAGAVLVVQLVEPDVLLRGRGEELDGHVDQTETDGAAPDGSWHGSRDLPPVDATRTCALAVRVLCFHLKYEAAGG